MLLTDVGSVIVHPLAGGARDEVHVNVVRHVDAVLLQVGQNARQPLVLDLPLVIPGVVLLDHHGDRNAEEDDGKLDDVVERAAHPPFFWLRHDGKLGGLSDLR